MGYMAVIGHCFACKRLFSFNADWVPSVRVNGVREPVCKDCIDQANIERRRKGTQPIYIHPDAYAPQEVD